ncbi:MAG: malto-oligosyltrehalose synthase, partial [Elusimicrobia bacterium]|nr:malto-oligosyltrehalose synthase [Elusimicrobiota bacterium]
HYRLAHWKVASEEFNYRRFFNINELAALRMEEEAVFAHCHSLVLRLVAERRIHGLRIDHIDGLYDPAGYLARLQRACGAALDLAAGPGGRPFYVVVEKILERRETLPDGWPVHGTVGYEFLNALGGLFVDGAQEKEIDAAYGEWTGQPLDFDGLVYSTKKLFAAEYMASEIHALGHRLDRLSEDSRHYRDFTRFELTVAMREIVDCFPVYRTYISPEDTAPSERDAQYLKIAIEKARRRTPALDPALYDFLQDLLMVRIGPPRIHPEAAARYRDIVLRFQQLTGPIMAKGLEDTAFYASSRLLCLNEVGGDPAHFGVSPQDFHQQNTQRAQAWPGGLLPTSTHDTTRSEDARHRLAALSELAPAWRASGARWRHVNAKHKLEVAGQPQPSGDAEVMLYQTLLAVWPDRPFDDGRRAALLERLWEHALKAAREAKRETNWVRPGAEYEAALRRFLERILEPGPENLFLPDFEAFAARVVELGRLNSLSALTLKLASPGVVDTYQGCETWSLRLVDPDNRRPVDFDELARLLAEVRSLPAEESARTLLAERADGRIKLLLLHRGLQLRRREPALFVGADYLPLRVEGTRARNVVAFARKTQDHVAVAAAGRFFGDFGEGPLPPLPAAWGDTRVVLPPVMQGWGFRDAYTGRIVAARPQADGAALSAAELFDPLPCALLTATR